MPILKIMHTYVNRYIGVNMEHITNSYVCVHVCKCLRMYLYVILCAKTKTKHVHAQHLHLHTYIHTYIHTIDGNYK